jgi:hypothetical protein
VLLLRLGGSLMNGWMWRPAEAEAINRQAPRAKGALTGTKTGWAGRPRPTGPDPFWPGSVSLPGASRSIVDLFPYACGPFDVVFSTVWTELLVVQASASSV